MSLSEPDPDFLPDGRPIWSATPQERAARQREAERAAFQRAQAEAEEFRRRLVAVEAQVRERLDAGMPSASTLGVDVEGLGPARARLVVGLAWTESERAKLPGLEQRRDAFLRALGASANTKAEVVRIETAVGDAVRKFYAAGSPPEEAPELLRHRERIALIEQLAKEDAYAAEVSAGLLTNAEVEIEAQRRIVEELEQRKAGWISDAVIEVGQPIGVRIEKLMAELTKELALATALGAIVQQGSDLRHVRNGATLSTGIALPWCSPTMAVPGGRDVEAIVGDWEKVRSAIKQDPRVQVSPPKSRELLPEPQSIFTPKPAGEVSPPATLLRRVVQAMRPESAQPASAPAMEGMQFANYRGPL